MEKEEEDGLEQGGICSMKLSLSHNVREKLLTFHRCLLCSANVVLLAGWPRVRYSVLGLPAK